MYIDDDIRNTLKDIKEYLLNTGDKDYTEDDIAKMIWCLTELLLDISLDPEHNR